MLSLVTPTRLSTQLPFSPGRAVKCTTSPGCRIQPRLPKFEKDSRTSERGSPTT